MPLQEHAWRTKRERESGQPLAGPNRPRCRLPSQKVQHPRCFFVRYTDAPLTWVVQQQSLQVLLFALLAGSAAQLGGQAEVWQRCQADRYRVDGRLWQAVRVISHEHLRWLHNRESNRWNGSVGEVNSGGGGSGGRMWEQRHERGWSLHKAFRTLHRHSLAVHDAE